MQSLEISLSHVVKEFEREQRSTEQRALVESESSKVEIAKLMRTVEMADQRDEQGQEAGQDHPWPGEWDKGGGDT